ncbi:MAG: methyltransferase domain-containing protein [Bacillota bacterium]
MTTTTEQSSLGHKPEGKWAFDESVTDCFSDMLARSIPQYDVMRQAVFDLAYRFVQPHTEIVDLGCSRGDALAPLIDKYGAYNRFVGLEVSEPMLAAARERFQGFINCGVVDIRKHDLRQGLPSVSASVVMSVLTLQFTPIEYRHRIVRSVYEHLLPGGAFILVEKVLGEYAELDDLMVSTYYAMKGANGYSQDEIQRKRMSLEGVLVPVTARWNEQLLHSAGFTQVDCFWRWMNFAGWIAVK